MDKKNVQNQTRRNTFGKNARGYNINGPKGLKERDDRRSKNGAAGHSLATAVTQFILSV
jgi:hypothetical protein